MRLATESLNGIGENYYEDLMSFNSLSLECNLFGPGHLFDIGAMGSLGLSMGKYYNIDQMIDFIQIQPSFRVFGILRVHLLNKSFKALDMSAQSYENNRKYMAMEHKLWHMNWKFRYVSRLLRKVAPHLAQSEEELDEKIRKNES